MRCMHCDTPLGVVMVLWMMRNGEMGVKYVKDGVVGWTQL